PGTSWIRPKVSTDTSQRTTRPPPIRVRNDEKLMAAGPGSSAPDHDRPTWMRIRLPGSIRPVPRECHSLGTRRCVPGLASIRPDGRRSRPTIRLVEDSWFRGHHWRLKRRRTLTSAQRLPLRPRPRTAVSGGGPPHRWSWRPHADRADHPRARFHRGDPSRIRNPTESSDVQVGNDELRIHSTEAAMPPKV